MPEVHLDFAFVRRDEEEAVSTILIAKHRQSRAVRTWRVPRKGECTMAAGPLAQEGLLGFGIARGQPVTLKCDNENAILALRDRLAVLQGGGVLKQSPAPHEHESNGVIENGVKLGKGLLRVHLFSLEEKVSGRLPTTHPAFAWLVGHSSAVMTKHLRGKDGRTAYSRLFGKEASTECLEFGERLFWKAPRTASHNVLLEPRWHEGVWLGQHWGGPTHYVFDPAGKTVVEVRAVRRMPAGERWRLEAVQAVCVWPKHQDPGEDGEARIIPQDAPRAAAPPTEARRQPQPVALRREDFEKYSYTDGCSKCAKMHAGHSGQGYTHSKACRDRMTAHLKAAGDHRAAAADRRWSERILAEPVPDPSVQPAPVAQEDRVIQEPLTGADAAVDGDAPDDPPAPQAPDGVHEQRDEDMDGEPNTLEEEEVVMGEPGGSDGWPGALRRLAKTMPPDLRSEVGELPPALRPERRPGCRRGPRGG